jgi:hypothetical protein
VTVGAGSAASCSEQALRTAIAQVKGTGGGTVLFDCGGEHTIILTEAVLSGCDFVNNSATSCHEAMTDQGGNLQWPPTKASGNPDPPCVDGITFADPLLQPLADNGGFSMNFTLGAGSAALDHASDCPAYDQRGQPRGQPCDTGAYEAGP